MPASATAQRGAASLIVVMLLFFVLSLTAAYTSRNLIFEQKTSANQSRSTAAFEAAEAGVEWTLAQLNGGLINDNCTDAVPTLSFQQRYVTIDPGTGFISQTVRAGSSLSPSIWPTCVFNGADWTCACPNAAAASPAAPVGAGPFPAFRVWPATPEPSLTLPAPAGTASSPWVAVAPARPGFLPINSVGCTRLPAGAADTCLDFAPRGDIGEGLSALRVTLALRSGLAVPPAAAVTARLSVTPDAAAPMRVVNKDERSGGFTVNTGAAVNKALFEAQTIDGSPVDKSFVDGDARLSELSTQLAPATVPPAPAALNAGERMFVATFGMKRQTYLQQPGLRVCATPCTAAGVNTLLQNNPDRIIWVEGDLTVNANIGTPGGAPVLLIINGDTLTMDPNFILHGFVYLTGDGAAVADMSTIALSTGAPQIQGALVAEGGLQTTGTGGGGQLTVTYDSAALERLRLTYGSWVRLAGSWRDFKAN